MTEKEILQLLGAEVPPVKLGNKNKTGKCGMCGEKVKQLFPCKVGQVDFMICKNCKSIMDFTQYFKEHVQSLIWGEDAIDAVPVVRGEWIVTDAYPHRVYCSLCYKTNVLNEEWLFEKNEYPKFCMWCGAKMEGNA